MKTNIEEIRTTTKALFDCVSITEADCGCRVCQHPFTNSMDIFLNSQQRWLRLDNDADYQTWRTEIFKVIDTAPLHILYIHIGTAWKMTWFKFVQEFMSKQDYADYLKDCWIAQENPNQDVNVSLREAVGYFQRADKKLLMDAEEQKHYKELPSKVTIFRGVSPGRERNGLSWTDDKEKAVWFKERFERMRGDKGYLLTATIPKKHILAYINARDEKELVVDIFKIKSKITEVIL